MNPDTTFQAPEGIRYADALTDRLFDLVHELKVAQNKFDEGQIVEAIKQALESGDFVKYIVAEPGPPPEAWNGMLRQIGMEPSGKYKFTTRSMVSYEPGREAARLREKIENAERLEWQHAESLSVPFTAATPFGEYAIRMRHTGHYRWAFGDEWDEEDHMDADLAKAAAESNWHCRIFDLLGGTL